jgi:hypothetical protein
MHFEDTTWFDYVRGLLTPDEAWLMQQHLTVGCEECTRAHAFWLRMHDFTTREASYEPDPSDIGRAMDAMASKTLDAMPSGLLNVAVLTFDSFRQATSAGFRSGQAQVRYMVYEAGAWAISLRLKNELGGHILLTGHIARRQAETEENNEMALILQEMDTPLRSTSTNPSGEFHMQYRSAPNLCLYVNVSPKETLQLRLPDPELSDGERGFEE